MRDHTQDDFVISPGDPLVPAPRCVMPRTFESWVGDHEVWKADVHDETVGTRRVYVPVSVRRGEESTALKGFCFDVSCGSCGQFLYRTIAAPQQHSAHHLGRAYDRIIEHVTYHPTCLKYRWVNPFPI